MNDFEQGKREALKGEVKNPFGNKAYVEGYDYGQGIADGSKQEKEEQESFAALTINSILGGEALDKLGRSESYGRGYDRGRETYGKQDWEISQRDSGKTGAQKQSDSNRDSAGSSVGYTGGGAYSGSSVASDGAAGVIGALLIIGVIIVALVFGAKSCLNEVFKSGHRSRYSSYTGSVNPNYQRYSRSSSAVDSSAVESDPKSLSSPAVKQPSLSYWTSINQMKSVIDQKPIQSYTVPKLTIVSVESVSAGAEIPASPSKVDYSASIEKMKADLEAQSIDMAKIRDEIRADVASIHGGD